MIVLSEEDDEPRAAPRKPHAKPEPHAKRKPSGKGRAHGSGAGLLQEAPVLLDDDEEEEGGEGVGEADARSWDGGSEGEDEYRLGRRDPYTLTLTLTRTRTRTLTLALTLTGRRRCGGTTCV